MLDYIPNWLVSYFRGYLFHWTETICLSTRQKSTEQHVTSVSLESLINSINIAQLHLSFEKINFPSATLVTERYVRECILNCFSHVWLFATPWTVVCQAPLSMGYGILQARILEWVVMPFYRGSSWPRNQTWVSCISRQIFFLTIWATREAWTKYTNSDLGNSLVVQSLGLHTSTARGLGSICDWGTKIPTSYMA